MNLGALLTKCAKTFSRNVAIRYGDYDETYADLNERINSLANALLDLGLAKGERVAIIQNNCPQLIESIFACFKARFISVPMNSRLHHTEFSYMIRDSGSLAVIFGPEFRDTMATIAGNLPSVKSYISLSNPDKGVLDYERILRESSTAEPAADACLDDVAWLFYTSGTTGRPKGAMLTQRNLLLASMSFLADVYHANASDVGLHAAPLTHGSGLYALPLLAKGATNIILRAKSFDSQLFLETIERKKVTVLPFLAPTMIKMLILSPRIDLYDLSSLRCIVYGGAPMYEEDMKEAVKRFGRILVQIYGQGETPMTISYLPMEDHVLGGTMDQMKRLLSAGIARTDVEVKVFDSEDHELPSMQMGEIVVRGDEVMKGYWNRPEDTAEALRNGWLHTGDIGYMDTEGYIFILDRRKDMIISGGSNIYPREVEEVLLQHPSVQECAVIGVPDEVWGESVKAIVVVKPGSNLVETELIEYCRNHLASYKKPKSVEFVEVIPKNAYGKVLKRELREKYWAERGRKI